MSGGLRLFWAFASLLVLTAVLAGDDSQSSSSGKAASNDSVASHASPPMAAVKPMEENLHGTKIVDNYRWLEDGSNPETQKWVEEEMAYTQAVLNPLPGREAIHKRLTDLLMIGSIGVPQIAGKYYFYTRREGLQNQPILYVRERAKPNVAAEPKISPASAHEGVGIVRLRGSSDSLSRTALRSASLRMTRANGDSEASHDRVLFDANQLAADGTIALDWYQPSENGKYLAYGTSPSGSEMSTLHILETKTGNALPDTIERTRAASIAWMHD